MCVDDNMMLQRMIRDKNEGSPVDEETVRIGSGLDEAILSSFTIAAAAASQDYFS